MIRCCPECKRPLPPEVKIRGAKRQQMYDFIAAHPEGVTRPQIMDHLYRDDPNGGPEFAQIVPVMANKINKQLKEMGLRIQIRGSGGPGSVYRIIYPQGEGK